MDMGANVNDLETPALWVDLDIMEKNIAVMAERMRAARVNWRPHTKGIKVPEIARKLLDAGAIGVTCAKISEAEFMAASGIKDILIGNQVVGAQKIARLVKLQRISDVMVAVDDLENARQISEQALQAGVKIRVLVELNIGMNRAGIEPRENAVDFVRQLCEYDGLVFKGLRLGRAYCWNCRPTRKRYRWSKSDDALLDTAGIVRQAGFPVEIVSCGGTGSYKISSYALGVTEIQAGGAIFCDLTYKAWGAETQPALFVLTTVTSRNVPDRAVVDGGRKTFPAAALPCPYGILGVELTRLSSEHGILHLGEGGENIKVGDKINFVVGYGDWTVFAHQRLYGVRQGIVEKIWDIPHSLV